MKNNKMANISRSQLKEIIRKVYLKDVIKENVDEGLKTQLSNILSNFFANEKNLIIDDEYDNYFKVEISSQALENTLNKAGFTSIPNDGFSIAGNIFILTLKKTK